ncbi:MAG: YbaN family protein [Bacteroidales bacterium]|nr:YbaN family protein [Bacteroidales bacterium]
MKILLAVLGMLALILGIVGIFLPVLPTTPFLLLAAALFLRSSRPLYDWLMNHPKLGSYISNFMVHKSIPLKVKVISVSMVWITLLYCAVAVARHWAFSLFFVLLAAGITWHILSYKTKK